MGAFSAERLRRLDGVLAGYAERGEVPGLVGLVARGDEVHVATAGSRLLGGGEPVERDTIFRISSMTKPLVAAAAMVLVEECRLRLDDPVTGLLPELAGRRVLTTPDGPLDDTVPADRDITLRDLLTLRLGFGFLFRDEEPPIVAAARERELGMGPPKPAPPFGPDEWLRRFAELPLMNQPGRCWTYEMGFGVLGVLVARAAGQPLGEFLAERVLEPLGMHDTGFHVPEQKIGRLASCYTPNPETGQLDVFDAAEDGQWSRPPAFPDARGGMVSTVDDYLAFGRMLLRDGRHGGGRLLSRSSVRLMTTDHLTAAQRAASENVPVFLDDLGWGFGTGVVTRRSGVGVVPGQFGWDGGLGAQWRCDPAEDLVTVLMAQTLPPCWPLFADFLTLAYQALAD